MSTWGGYFVVELYMCYNEATLKEDNVLLPVIDGVNATLDICSTSTAVTVST